ncbi:excalibur calcium-binding domain-containing protein [Polymorphospora rubra]|nr:excalibur calcium-binding domain-containing protein [Polymorphospora rubra]
MTPTIRARLGILAAAAALPILLACGAGASSQPDSSDPGSGGSPTQMEQQASEQPVVEVPDVETPDEEPTAPAEEPAEEEVSYKNCTEVREAGKAPLREGDPGYSSKLDRDGDGVACER